MFAYCLNNPVNRVDTLGSASVWWYFIEAHDMGFIHRAVQAHIKESNYYIGVETEFTIFSGRADIKVGTYVWEIKHAGMCPEARAQVAKNQAEKYIDGTTITSLGAANAFSGSFYIQCGDVALLVEYSIPINGAILYTVKEDRNYNRNFYRQFLTLEQRNENKQMMTMPNLFANNIFYSGTGGGGSTMIALGMLTGAGCLLVRNYNTP